MPLYKRLPALAVTWVRDQLARTSFRGFQPKPQHVASDRDFWLDLCVINQPICLAKDSVERVEYGTPPLQEKAAQDSSQLLQSLIPGLI